MDHRQGRSSPVRAKIAYGVGDAGFLMVWQGAALFLLFFFVEVAGLPPLLAGAIFLTGMIWDALSDPLFAAFAERRAARGLSYARLVAAAAPLVGLSYAALFLAPQGPVWVAAAWALLGHLVFRSAFSLASMPYNALPARLSLDSGERTRFTAARVAGAAIGGLAAAAITPMIAEALGAGAAGYAAAGAVLGGLAAGCLLLCGFGVREAADAPTVSAGEGGYAHDLAGLLRFMRLTGPVQRLLGVMATATLGFAVFTGALLFHLNARPDLAAHLPVLLAAPSLASLAAAFVWPAVAARTSNRTALCAGAVLAGAGFIAFGADAGFAAALAALVVIGAGLSAIPVMLWSMAADAIDYGHLKGGARVEARVFGVFTFVQKTAAGAASLLIAAGLALGGAGADGVMNAASPMVMTVLVSAVPAGFMVLTALIARGYAIDRAAHAAIVQALAEVKNPPAR